MHGVEGLLLLLLLLLLNVAREHAGRLELLRRREGVHERDLLLLADHVLLQHEGNRQRRVGEGHLQSVVRGGSRRRGRLADLSGRMTRPASSPCGEGRYLAGGGCGGGSGVLERNLLLRPLGLGGLAANVVVPLGAHDFGGGLVFERDEREAAVPSGQWVVQQGDVGDLAERGKVGDEVVLGRVLPDSTNENL